MDSFSVNVPPPPPESQSSAKRRSTKWSQTATNNFGAPPPPLPAPDDNEIERVKHRKRFMIWLARRTWLLLYGTSGLTPVAFKNIASASVLLAILWMVDVVAWTGMWNMLFTGTLREVTPFTIAAVVLGVLFATGILNYESSFLSADLRKSSFPALSVSIRVALILFFAFVTSLPFDLFLLDSQVNQRIHQEQVLMQLPQLIRAWEVAKQEATGLSAGAEKEAGTVEQRHSVVAATNDRSSEQEALASIRAQRITAQRHLSTLESQLSQGGMSSDDRALIEASLQRALVSLKSLQQAESQAAAKLQLAIAREQDAQINLEKTEAQINWRQTKQAVADASRYENWIHDLWTAKPLQFVRERSTAGPSSLEYNGPVLEQTGIGERLIVMGDILAARPPRRPRMSTGDREALAQMKLNPFVEGDPQAIFRQQIEASSLRRLALACMGLFTVLPLLIFAQKFLFEEDTRRYFDSDYQRAIDNPDVTRAPFWDRGMRRGVDLDLQPDEDVNATTSG